MNNNLIISEKSCMHIFIELLFILLLREMLLWSGISGIISIIRKFNQETLLFLFGYDYTNHTP